MDKEKLKVFEELEREIFYYSEHTKDQYRAHAGDYLSFVGNRDWRDRDVLYNYIEKQRKRGVSQSHINYIIRGPVGAIFRAHGLRIPVKLPRFAGPQIDLTSRVSFSPEDVVKIINTCLESGNIQWQAVLALSTTFGLRAGELLQLRKDDVKPNKKTVMIYTLKYGTPREHLIPPQIYPYLVVYSYPPISKEQLYEVFNQVSNAAGLERVPRKVYHAIRHSVYTGIRLNGVEEGVAMEFMRWRLKGMSGVYFTPQAFHIDNIVYPKHPFLKYWEGG